MPASVRTLVLHIKTIIPLVNVIIDDRDLLGLKIILSHIWGVIIKQVPKEKLKHVPKDYTDGDGKRKA